MPIAAVLCAVVALVSAAFGLRALTRPRTGDPIHQARRILAPAQLATAVMLAAGAVVALARPPHGAVAVLVICVIGALGTLAAGSWQSARYAARVLTPANCHGGCACSQPCD